jgi:hypothetical protein
MQQRLPAADDVLPLLRPPSQAGRTLDADESRFCTRVKATFCCYCSEVQVWREVKASGVWPGQLCCTASQSDREYMARAAVRGRYSVDGEYAVEATSPAGGCWRS